MNSDSSVISANGHLGPVLLLGGSGFIGTRLAALLIQRGVPVRIGDLRRSEAFPQHWVDCDVRKPESLAQCVSGARAIVNLAAEHRDDVRPLSRYYETNVDGATNVCCAAVNAGIQSIIFTSSVAVYGFHPYAVDERCPCEPFNEYGKTKLAAETIYRAWSAENMSRSLVIVRPTVVFGEGNRGNVYNLLRQIAARRFFMVGSGYNTKSMAYVGNVAAFLLYALSLGQGEQIFNYVDGPDMTTKQLVEHGQSCLRQTANIRSVPRSVALAGAHAMDLIARLSGRNFPISAIRIRKFCENTQFTAKRTIESGFRPPFTLSEGLARTIQFDFPENIAQN
jgi:nucleoside-diphosphate-sugar epimerase